MLFSIIDPHLPAYAYLQSPTAISLQSLNLDGPQFPDPFTIGNNEVDYLCALKSKLKTTISRKHQGSPYTYSSAAIKAEFYRAKNTPSLASIHGPSVKPLQDGMQDLQAYLQAVLKMLEAVDVCLGGTGPQEVADALGAAIGRFLVGNNPVPHISDTQSSHAADQSPLSEDYVATVRASDGSAHSESFVDCRPAWVPFSAGGMEVFLQVEDTQGGKLSLRNEDQLLRAQEHKCFGCGERLLTGDVRA